MYSSDNEDFGKFLKKPKAGQKVKVYSNESRIYVERKIKFPTKQDLIDERQRKERAKARYGIVLFIKEVEGREYVVLEETHEIIPPDECDYCLEKRKVEFFIEDTRLKDSIKESKKI